MTLSRIYPPFRYYIKTLTWTRSRDGQVVWIHHTLGVRYITDHTGFITTSLL